MGMNSPFISVNDSPQVRELKKRILESEQRIDQLETGMIKIIKLHFELSNDFRKYKRYKQHQ